MISYRKIKNEEKNPDWAEMFSDSEEIFKTMEELTKLQMEGADVYMSAFANMKHFDFLRIFRTGLYPSILIMRPSMRFTTMKY